MKENDYPKVYLYRRVVQAKLFIDSNYSDALDIDAIADEAYFSKFHFIRLFREMYGKTPHQYLIQVRINKAITLLKNNIPVSEVCHSVGFESLSSFSGLFKRTSGLSPTTFQAQQQIRKEEILTKPLKFVPHCFASRMTDSKK